MKKIIFCLLLLISFGFAKPLVLEICNPNFCYEQIIQDAKKWEYIHDFTGKKYVLLYFYDTRRLLDIKTDGMSVRVKT